MNVVNSGLLADNGLIIVKKKKTITDELIANLKLKTVCVKELKNGAKFYFLAKQI